MIFAKHAKLSNGWAENVRLTVGGGRIETIEPDQVSQPSDTVIDTLEKQILAIGDRK